MIIACNYYIAILSFIEGSLVNVIGCFSAWKAAFLRRSQGLPRQNDQTYYDGRFRRWSSGRRPRSNPRQAAETGDLDNETPNLPGSVLPDSQDANQKLAQVSGPPENGAEMSRLLGDFQAQDMQAGEGASIPVTNQGTSTSTQSATLPRTKRCNALAKIGEE